jgi:Lrp/AsnC ligand binding domain
VAVYCLGGTTDFLVHVVCRDTEHLRRLTILSFTSRPEVSRIETSLVFSYTRREGHIRQRGVEALKTTHRPSPEVAPGTAMHPPSPFLQPLRLLLELLQLLLHGLLLVEPGRCHASRLTSRRGTANT